MFLCKIEEIEEVFLHWFFHINRFHLLSKKKKKMKNTYIGPKLGTFSFTIKRRVARTNLLYQRLPSCPGIIVPIHTEYDMPCPWKMPTPGDGKHLKQWQIDNLGDIINQVPSIANIIKLAF